MKQPAPTTSRAGRPASDAPFPRQPEQRWFEDYRPGLVLEFGAVPVDEAEVIEFARRYDPQPFHVDPVAAARGAFGGLIASGWHTGSLMMRLLVEHYLSPLASLGSPGIDELRWLAPVRPGDTLTVRVTVLEARRSQSKPDRGLVRASIEVLNQRREPVMRLTALNFTRCRPPAAGG
jgi:acyl dehydratase